MANDVSSSSTRYDASQSPLARSVPPRTCSVEQGGSQTKSSEVEQLEEICWRRMNWSSNEENVKTEAHKL
jgi:hypothetical protein